MAGREISDEPDLFLATLTPTSGQRRSAVAVVVALLILFGVAAPLAAVQLPRSPAFVAFQQGILCVSDLITAALLFSQFSFIRSRILLVLASGYLFTALIVIPHTLTFPGAFTPTGLLGAGLQSTAWLYIFWHLGFPLALLAYAWLKHERLKKYVTQVSTLYSDSMKTRKILEPDGSQNHEAAQAMLIRILRVFMDIEYIDNLQERGNCDCSGVRTHLTGDRRRGISATHS
jgi:hypothetical protein